MFEELIKKLLIGYIHFIRRPIFVFFARRDFFKNNKITNPNYFLSSNNYLSDDFKEKLLQNSSYEEIISEAKIILENKFETLGSEMFLFGEKINWHLDFKSGRIWEKEFYTKINSGHSINGSDIKVPWELSRFHQTIWLAKAYIVTKDEKYSKKIIELINDWIEENPFCYGVNWTCAMEVAIRSVNWIISLEAIRTSKSFSKEFEKKILNSLYQHGIFIRNNLEYGRRNGNHFLSDLMGLVWLGALFVNLPFGKSWIEYAKNNLDKEIEFQVYGDGVDYEKSTYYQRLVFEILYNSQIALQSNYFSLSDSSLNKMKLMLDYILTYVMDETIPNIGDNDNGRVTKYSYKEKINDFGGAVLIGSALFNNHKINLNYKEKIEKTDLLFLLGPESYRNFDVIQFVNERFSSAFPSGGFYFLKNQNLSIYIDAGDIGMNGWGGHGHNDVFSYELYYKGLNFICDSGTFCYTSDKEIRQKLRSTQSHNTIMIDNKEQAEFLNLFRIKKDVTSPKIIKFSSSEHLDVLVAEHYGYLNPNDGIVHKREFIFNKDNNVLEIYDFLNGEGLHTIDYFMNFHPEVNIISKNSKEFLLKRESLTIKIKIECEYNCSTKLVDHINSESYGMKRNNKKFNLTINDKLPTKIKTTFRLE